MTGVVTVIPARGGSKGLPGKNLRLLMGEPLILHSIRHAQAAEKVDDVYVSTDDEEIADESSRAGAHVIKRPAELAGDAATSESALLHALDVIQATTGAAPDTIVFLQCTSPIRGASDIDSALDLYEESGASSLLSVVETHRYLWRQRADGFQSVNYDWKSRQRRQDFSASYMENGSIYICSVSGLRKYQNRLFGKIVPYVMGQEAAYEIDSELDFIVVEAIMKYRSMHEE